MASALVRLLALFALVLMPLSMAGSPASAQPAAAAPSSHCNEHQQPADMPSGQQMHCMACAGLPAVEPPAPAPTMRPETPALSALADFAAGIRPDTATPPPKRG